VGVHSSHPDIINRLKRAEGHIRSVIKAMEEGRPCLEHAVRDGLQSADDTIREFKAITKYL